MKYNEVMTRIAEIDAMNPEEMELEELKAVNEERTSLESMRTDYEENGKALAEKRKAIAEDETIPVIKKFEDKPEERKMENLNVEYRNAFLKNLLGEELSDVEQRAFVHTTDNTGAVVPEETLNKIYSTMEEAHPILKDVQILRTGAVISIAKHTAIVAGDAAIVAEGVANDDEQNTFVNVTLSGKDFSKHVDFSYRLGKMAIPAFEQYLVKEISDRLGAAMADDIVAQIKTDLAVANKVDADVPGTLAVGDVLSGLALLKAAPSSNIYVSSATFYGDIASMQDATTKLSFLPNYQESVSGQLLGKNIKIEDSMADGEVLILDPNQFVYNVVQDVMLERDKNIKTHVHTIAGFAIAEGTLTNDKAGALVTVGTAL